MSDNISRRDSGAFDLSSGWGTPSLERVKHSHIFLHVPEKECLRVVVLSEEPVRYVGHWANGRMWPCQRIGCKFCARRLGSQVRYVFCVYDLTLGQNFLLEVGAYTSECLYDIRKQYPSCAGLVVRFYHHNKQKRARIEVDFEDYIPNLDKFPPCLDVMSILLEHWRSLIISV